MMWATRFCVYGNFIALVIAVFLPAMLIAGCQTADDASAAKEFRSSLALRVEVYGPAEGDTIQGFRTPADNPVALPPSVFWRVEAGSDVDPSAMLQEMLEKKVPHYSLPQNMGDADLARVTNLGSARYLNLDYTRVTDDGLKHLANLPALESLDLSGTKVTDEGLNHLRGLRGLKVLLLTGSQVTDAGLVHLKGLANLEELSLELTQVTDAGLANLGALKRLQKLNLRSTKVSGLERLEDLSNLQWLDLCATQVTDAGLEHVKDMRQLQQLNLESTTVSDAGLDHFKKLESLRTLALGKTRVTGTGLLFLKDLRKLRNVFFDATATAPAKVDTGAELVKGFYELLLQKDPPTLEQQDAILRPAPALADRLVRFGHGKAGEAVLMGFFRSHKEWFLPKPKTPPADGRDILITTPYTIAMDIKGGNRDHHGTIYVMAQFFEDNNGHTMKQIVFMVVEGKLDVSLTTINSFLWKPISTEIMNATPIPVEELLRIMEEENRKRREIMTQHKP